MKGKLKALEVRSYRAEKIKRSYREEEVFAKVL